MIAGCCLGANGDRVMLAANAVGYKRARLKAPQQFVELFGGVAVGNETEDGLFCVDGLLHELTDKCQGDG